MIRIEGSDGHTPTRRLIAAIHQVSPQLATRRDPSRADLTIYPRATEPWASGPRATRRTWYDLYWTQQALTDCSDPCAEPGEQPQEIRPVRIRRVAALPPPPVIPAEQRLAEAPAATITDMSEQHIRLLGGPEAARRLVDDRRTQAVREDRSVDIYDWHALAAIAIDLIAGLTAPHLDEPAGTR
jgi:hypothetical protein